ncbi:MAG: DegT/DnrJ/EryC1/StrS family aminotransferase [Syntrophomonas sp.]
MKYDITVTKPYLPELKQYVNYLERIWTSRWVTNNGVLVREFEQKLRDYLGVPYVFFVSNGTIALQIALKALEVQDEVITTPFSFVATSSAILWENLIPIYADINPENYCINVDLIEQKITPKTRAILATHVYGHPCDVKKIRDLADAYHLSVIYDGAHAFGANYNGKSLLSYGDISTLSFHATKLFHTIEGGAVITRNPDIAKKIELLRNFGLSNNEYIDVGINAKNSEFHAAIGLSMFDAVPEIIQKRKYLSGIYSNILSDTYLTFPKQIQEEEYNYAYYPIFFEAENQLVKVKNALEKARIESRRYFFPSLNKLLFINGSDCSLSEEAAKTALCLPLYYDLSDVDCKKVALIVKENL